MLCDIYSDVARKKIKISSETHEREQATGRGIVRGKPIRGEIFGACHKIPGCIVHQKVQAPKMFNHYYLRASCHYSAKRDMLRLCRLPSSTAAIQRWGSRTSTAKQTQNIERKPGVKNQCIALFFALFPVLIFLSIWFALFSFRYGLHFWMYLWCHMYQCR